MIQYGNNFLLYVNNDKMFDMFQRRKICVDIVYFYDVIFVLVKML